MIEIHRNDRKNGFLPHSNESLVNNRYRKDTKLGEGTYGEVCKAVDILSNTFVALKKVKADQEEEGIPSTALREIAILRDISHPNIVKLLDVYNSEKHLYLIFEYCNTDLHKFLKNNPQDLSIDFIRHASYQMLDALAFMHSHRILHRDIKPSNVLLSGDVVKLADFGLARSISIPIKRYTVEVVTMWYRPPELIQKYNVYGSGIDIWGMGAVIAEMILHEPIFRGDSDIDQLHKIFDILGTPKPSDYPDLDYFTDKKVFDYFPKNRVEILTKLKTIGGDGYNLLMKMFEYNPGKRISAREAMKDPFFIKH
ncbi:cell division protein kinase 2 putative [Entamoeba histolytica]|uniref:Cyclin-dependent kinase 2 n=4 Tax=Entamoeba histolytica TaxID=5759 RepID=C4LSA6_ENTH1|nr:cell division protein kinase, putative [Entamoeba histolytica HM-1:IMSS]EAL50962.1 cell division protein kinase, putative [Entamoeba histolytica HM-1:IMSS]GAT91568.1 cell division protein kinase 2 putative [Entamoeba histolytica]|eukprot:XP_656401.1 cell division protein kinase, putative [Entamoeba histolytica HM-1:IMSS]